MFPSRKRYRKGLKFNYRTNLVVMLDASDPASFTASDLNNNGRQQIQTWADKSGNGNNFAVTPGKYGPEYYLNLFGGKGGAAFTQAGHKSITSVAAIVPDTYSNNMTVIYVMQRISSYQSSTLTNVPSNEVIEGFPDAGIIGYRAAGDGISGRRLPFLTDTLYATVMPPSGVMKHYIGNLGPIETYSGLAGHPFTSKLQKLEIGGSPLYSGSGEFKLGLILIYNKAFTDAEITSVMRSVNNTLSWNIPQPPQPYNFVMDGNSLVDCRGIGEDVWPVLLPKQMAIGQNNFIMAGKAGQNIQSMITNAPALVDSYYELARPAKQNVVLMWEITNQLTGVNETAASVQTLIQQYCLARRAAGWKVIVGTCLPRTTGKANFEADRQTINQWVRTNYLSFADGVADMGGDLSIGQDGQQNGANYIGDGIHLSIAGHAIVTTIFKAALDLII